MDDTSKVIATNPYGTYVDGINVLASLQDTPVAIAALVNDWTSEMLERSYAAGKWSARQLLIHLAHAEMVFGERARFGLNKPDYVVIPFDQDEWMALDEAVDAHSALAAYQGGRSMNLAFFRSLTPAQRAHTFTHPERGRVNVEWVIRALAGHERHHLSHFQMISRG